MREKVRYVGVLLLLIAVFPAFTQNLIWQEDFNLPNGTTVDNVPPSQWTIDVSQANLNSKNDYFEVRDGSMEGRDLDGEVRWISETINISSFTNLTVSLDVFESGNPTSADYVRAYYILDGGSETLFGDITGNISDGGPTQLSVSGLNGGTISIIVKVRNDGGGEVYILDNITVAVPGPLYSISNGNWNDNSNWSYSRSGPSCGCTPSLDTPVTITSGTGINLNVDTAIPSLTIENTGSLTWVTGSNLDISNSGSLVVLSGGSIDRNGQTAALLQFLGNGEFYVESTGSVLLEDFRTYGSVNISGTGDLNINDELLINGSGNSIYNSVEGGISVNDRVHFEPEGFNNVFFNNAPLNIAGNLFFTSEGCRIDNNSTISVGNDILISKSSDINNGVTNSSFATISLNSIDLSNAPGFQFSNAGTVNMTGTFLTVPAENTFINQTGGTWNYAGTGDDADLSIDLTARDNTFNYVGTDQDMISSVSDYWNLGILGSGTKTAPAALNIDGDMNVTSALSCPGDVNLAGDCNSPGTLAQSSGQFVLDGDMQEINPGSGFISQLIVNGTGSKAINGDMLIQGDVTINSELVMNGNITLSMEGNWVNNGNFIAGTSEIQFSGSILQEISGNTEFWDISVNKAGGIVSVESTSSVNGVLQILTPTIFDADGTANNQVFTLRANASGRAIVDQLPAGALITGDVTAEEYYSDFGSARWRYISLPVTGATVADIQNEIPVSGNFTGSSNGLDGIPLGATGSLAYYDNNALAPDLDTRWVFFPLQDNTEVLTSALYPGRGYAIYIFETGETFYDTRGQLNQGSIDFQPSGFNERWNLIGNPYPAPIDWDSPGWTKSGIQGNTIYVRSFDQYLIWNGSFGSLGSGVIPKGQSFWIQGSQDNVTLVANETVKSTVNSSHLRVEKKPDAYLEFTLSDGKREDKTYILISEDSDPEMDSRDALKYNNSIFNLSSLSQTGENLAINATNNLSCDFSIWLKLSNIQPGQYSLNCSNRESMDELHSIAIIDHFAGESYNLDKVDKVSFEINNDEDSYGSARFELQFNSIAPEEATYDVIPNCESSTSTINISNARSGFEYRIIKNNKLISEMKATGSSTDLTVSESDLQNGKNNLILQTVNPACGLSIEQELYIELYETPVISLDSRMQMLTADVDHELTWYRNEKKIESSGFSNLILEDLSGQYSASYTAPNGCEKKSEVLSVNLDNPVSTLSVFPNPVREMLYIGIDNPDQYVQMRVVDLRGSVISTAEVRNSLERIPVANLEPGSYIVQFIGESGTTSLHFIKQ